jgi:hypothetical protein
MELKKTDCLRAGQALKKMYPSYHYNWPEHGYLLRNDEFLSSAGGWRKISAPLQGSTVGAPNMDENLLTAGIEKINDKIKNMLAIDVQLRELMDVGRDSGSTDRARQAIRR